MTTATLYREDFLNPDEHPSGQWGFACSVCGRDVGSGPCPDHAPRDVPGLRLVECSAEPRHWLWGHDADDYGLPCDRCELAAAMEREAKLRQCRHWRWRRSRWFRWLIGRAYVLGIVAGFWSSSGDGHGWCVMNVRWRGSRSHILGVHRDTWRCWRRGHRRGEPIGFGFCAKCMPCPACGSKTAGHLAGCGEA